MTEWIMAHPWMTFFLALMVIEAAAKIAGAVCQTIITVHGGQQHGEGEEDAHGA